jgi:tricorn protease-like protein
MRRFIVVMIALLSAGSLYASQKPGYYRFPAIRGSTLVFTAEGDLWTVGTEGGIARRITSHPGVESYASISPDGDAQLDAAITHLQQLLKEKPIEPPKAPPYPQKSFTY